MNTKRLFKLNKEKNNRKITEFFQSNNNIPVSRVGTSIQIKKINLIPQRLKHIRIILIISVRIGTIVIQIQKMTV